MRAAAFLLAAFVCGGVHAQWQVPATVVLDGTQPEQRQVTGLAAPSTGTSGASVDAHRYNSTAFSVLEGGADLTAQLTPPLAAYVPGLRLTVVPQHANEGDVTLDVDGLGPVPVRKFVTAPLDSGDLVPGVPMDLIYDGAVFQVGNQLYPACPPAMRALGSAACIETASYDAVNWYTAAVRCADRGLRLCSFGEWMWGCQSDPAFITTVSDYEWVDDAANGFNTAKTMGINGATLVPDCQGGGHKEPLVNSRYRCCSDR